MFSYRIIIIAVLCTFFIASVFAQQTLRGIILDSETKEPLIGAAVTVEGTTTGTVTDYNGEFALEVTQQPPFNLVVSYLGYNQSQIAITSGNIHQKLKLNLVSSSVMVKGVEVVDTRITERLKESPLTVESMSLAAIKETPSASFYDGLGTLKGVDLTTASLGFVVVNTRGFNSTRPVRTLQLVDGADNQAPGLNFSLGNFVGSSELDIQKVELIVGASTAYYGPNAFNGVINMTTKNPFYHKGLSVLMKVGERSLFETGLRYARAFANKAGDDKFAFKINLAFMRAHDWEATNYAATEQSQVGTDNPGGYDAVNVYGDENLSSQANNYTDAYGRRQFPGLGLFHRTGYQEKDLVDYDTRNIKANTSLHYRLTKTVEAEYSFKFGTGTTVYQGDNRYSLKGLSFYQHKLEVGKPDKFFIRAYTTAEDAGQSYDAVFTALKLQEAVKSNADWNKDYANNWTRVYAPKVRQLPGYPSPFSFIGVTADSAYALQQQIFETYHDSLVRWHSLNRGYADSAGLYYLGNSPRLIPGTPEFDSTFNAIVSNTAFSEGGTRFYDKSKLYHVQGEYKFTPKIFDVTVGGSYRLYTPESDGTIFSDTIMLQRTNDSIIDENGLFTGYIWDTIGRNKITNWEYGVYGGIRYKFFKDRFIITATARMDKNENYDYLFSPALSTVYTQNDHTFRVSFSSAIRNPTLQDQYLHYNVGRALLIGNIHGVDSLVTIESLIEYLNTLTYEKLEFFNVPPVKPEEVKSIEIGYRGTLVKNLYFDASAYHSWYTNFLGFKLGASAPSQDFNAINKPIQIYRVSANSPDQVITYGFSGGFNYYFKRHYSVSGNYSWNVLDRKGSTDPIIPAFNTPEHKFNVGLGGQDIKAKIEFLNAIWDKIPVFSIKNIGFNINYKWIQGFMFEGSPQFTGFVPTYDLLDAQINYTNKKIHTTFKVGASNVLNDKHYQTYGGPYIGRLAYFAVLFDLADL